MPVKGVEAVADFVFLSAIDAVKEKGMPSYEELGINGINSALYNLIISDILAFVDPYLVLLNAEIAIYLKKIVSMTVIELVARKIMNGDMKFSRVVVKHIGAQLLSYVVMKMLPQPVVN